MNSKVALVSPHLFGHGGVSRMASLYYDILTRNDFEVECYSINTSWDGRLHYESRKWTSNLMKSEFREISSSNFGIVKTCGVAFPVLEISRYSPPKFFGEELNSKDLVILVSGTLAWNSWLKDLKTPSLHHFATLTAWERESRDNFAPIGTRSFRKWMTKKVSRHEMSLELNSDSTIVLNAKLLQWVQSHKSESVAYLIPIPVNTESFYPRTTWSPKRPLISVGRLNESRKGWSRLFKIYDVINETWPQVPDLYLVGNDDLSNKEQKILHNSPFKHKVKIFRNVSDSKLSRLLRNSSVFLSTSYEEGLGIAALEGLASGLPIVSSETYGASEYVLPDFNGYIVGQKSDDFEMEFAHKIERVLKIKGLEMSANSRELVLRHYSNEVIEGKVMSLIYSALSQSKNHT